MYNGCSLMPLQHSRHYCYYYISCISVLEILEFPKCLPISKIFCSFRMYSYYNAQYLERKSPSEKIHIYMYSFINKYMCICLQIKCAPTLSLKFVPLVAHLDSTKHCCECLMFLNDSFWEHWYLFVHKIRLLFYKICEIYKKKHIQPKFFLRV